MNDYMTDEELFKFISDIEECDLVNAPPEIEQKVFDKIDKKAQILEYKRFRNRVIIAVAAAVAIVSIPYEKIIDLSGYEYVRLSEYDEGIIDSLANRHYISDLLNKGDR